MHIIRDKPKNKGHSVLLSMAIVTAISCASYALAYLWQRAQEQPLTLLSSSPVSSGVPLGYAPAQDEQQQDDAVTQQPTQSSEDDENPAVNEPDYLYARERLSGALPPSARVDNAYFADAVFFGDSLSTGIPIYQVAGGPDTVAVRGASPYNVLTQPLVVAPDGEAMTMLEAAEQFGEKRKVYIMLGSNGLWMDKTAFANGYREFIAAVRAQYPGAVIYLQSIPPVTDHAHELYPTANNADIRELNEVIAQVAQQSDVYFVDVAQALVDAEGYLPREASPTDGMHLTPEYYQKWFEYLKTHTVEGSR